MFDIMDDLSTPSPSLERDFCRRRQARQKRPEDDISEQRPEIGDHESREMAAKAAFLLAGLDELVSEDWVVAHTAQRNRSRPAPCYSLLFEIFQGRLPRPMLQVAACLRHLVAFFQ